LLLFSNPNLPKFNIFHFQTNASLRHAELPPQSVGTRSMHCRRGPSKRQVNFCAFYEQNFNFYRTNIILILVIFRRYGWKVIGGGLAILFLVLIAVVIVCAMSFSSKIVSFFFEVTLAFCAGIFIFY
jgi:hypothetical protein